MTKKNEHLIKKYEKMKEDGLTFTIRKLGGPTQPHVKVDGKECIMLASNNYLNLANDPRLTEAGIEAMKKYGASAGSDWSIAGTMDVHEELWDKIAEFKETESGMTYPTGYSVNMGLIPQLADKDDVLIADELYHSSIELGLELSKADKMIYSHSDMEELENLLKEAQDNYNHAIIITAGVFTMDGDIAKMDEIQDLADEYGAMTYVDDSHGEGILGEGKGIAHEFDLVDRIDIEMGTFSKGLGGFGGMIAGDKDLIDYAYNSSKTWLCSAAFPPHIAAINKKAIEIVEEETDRVEKLWKLTKEFKKGIEDIGFNTGISQTPIVPTIVGDAKIAHKLSDRLYEEGIFAMANVYPMVAKDEARIRNQINAEMSEEDIDEVLRVYEKLGKELDLV